MTEDEYTEYIAAQRRAARQRLDDLLYDLRCTIWPRSPWAFGPQDPIEWEDELARQSLEHDRRMYARLQALYTPVLRPQDAFRVIVGTVA